MLYTIITIMNKKIEKNNIEEIKKQNYVKWLAPRLSSLFVERTKQEVKQDTTLTVQWEDNHNDMIDVAAEEISSSNDI